VQSDWGPYYQADTALHMAAIRNVPPVIEALIEIGCDPTVTNAKGETPLDVAQREDRPEDVCAVLNG
jgi:ankyrin repeat protein